MSTNSCNGFLRKASTSVDRAIGRFFEWEGRLVARYPYSTLLVTIAVTVFLGYMGVINFAQETRATELYVPEGSSTTADHDRVRDAFGFFPLTETLLVYSKKGSDTNLLESPRESLGELMSMWETMEDQDLGAPLTDYKSVCAKSHPGMPCKATTLLAFWDFNRTTLDNDPDPLGTINSVSPIDTYGNEISIEVLLGGIERDASGKIYKANVFHNTFTLETNFDPAEYAVFKSLREQGAFGEQEEDLEEIDHLLEKGFNPRPYALDEKITELFKGWEDRPDTKLIARMTHLALVTDEADGAINKDLAWMLFSVVLVGTYCHVVLFRNNWVHCKVHLVTGTMVAIIMAIVASIGLSLSLGVKVNLVVMAVPFLILGLGIDDTFIILGQYRKADPTASLVDRVAFALSKAGPSILVTSVTDLIAFTLSMFSTMPALHAFGVYASLGVAFDFLFQVTFFVALLALEARREDRLAQGGRFLGLISARKDQCIGKNPPELVELSVKDPSTANNEFEEKDAPQALKVSQAQRRIYGEGVFDHTAPSLTTKFIGEWIPSITLTGWGTAVVVVIEVVFLVVSAYGCTKTRMDFRYREWFPPKSSWLHDGYRLEHDYFFGEQNQIRVYTTDGSHFYNQEQMMNCILEIEESPYMSQLPESRSWFKEYVDWSRRLRSANLTDGWAADSDTFTDLVVEFLTSPAGIYYLDDVKINKAQNRISSTMLFTGYSKNVDSASYGISFMKDVRHRVAETVPLLGPAVVSQMFPFYEGLQLVVKDSVQNLLLAALAVVVVISVILAKLMAALVVSLVVVLTDVMLIGLMWYADLTFNMVTSICIVLAVGIAVDYSVHIAHSFLCQEGSRKERAAAALYAIGADVFSGALTSWFAIIGIALTTTYVLQVFFKMLTILILLGAWHGIIVLPILLANFGPSSYADA